MILTDKSEEILELLWIDTVEHKKTGFDLTALKDGEAIKELIDRGYINIESNRVTLTHKGMEEASGCVRRHRLAERLMVDVLDVKKKLMEETSCKFEHLLHKGVDENICTLLGHPRRCPHGRIIPEGRCCRDAKRMPRKVIMPLSGLEVNARGRISYLETHDKNALQKLIAMGALPNTEIRLIQKFPSYVFQVGKSQFAIDRELASQIYVRM